MGYGGAVPLEKQTLEIALAGVERIQFGVSQITEDILNKRKQREQRKAELQTPNKLQTLNFNLCGGKLLELGAWSFFGVWSLGFGV